MLWQQGRDVRGCSIGPICWEDALGQGEFPHVPFVCHPWGQAGVASSPFVDGVLVEIFPFSCGTVGGWHLQEGVGFRAILHQFHERLGPVSGVEGDEAEFALANPGGDSLGIGVSQIEIFLVAPPDDDICGIQRGLIHSLFGSSQGGRLDGDACFGCQVSGDGLAQKFVAVGLFLIRLLFIPNEHANGFGSDRFELRNCAQGERGQNGDGTFHG